MAPLDWGLGHATRCIPLIRALREYPVRILLAAEGPTRALLQEEFPDLGMLPLPGYRIRYSARPGGMLLAIVAQLPRMLWRTIQEHYWLRKVHKAYQLSAVISDNRFGLYHPGIPSIYITHQLKVKTGHAFTDRLATALHMGCIRRFSACWVPDWARAGSLAGALSHPEKLPANTQYIGPLSRLQRQPASREQTDLLLIISGPEPQRTLLEEKIWSELHQFKGSAVLIRGLPGDPGRALPAGPPLSKDIRVYHHLAAADLQPLMAGASLVISRSGYTTVMDIMQLGCRSVLVPTPGQAEQEYLAWHLEEQQYCCSVCQDAFTLPGALLLAEQFSYRLPEPDMESYTDAVRHLVDNL